MKVDKWDIVKVTGWVAAGIIGIVVNLASDKQTQEREDEALQERLSTLNEES